MTDRKIVCIQCDWCGSPDETLKDFNPFNLDEKIHGCPQCKSIDEFRIACDEPGCDQTVECGTNTKDGYRATCLKHRPDQP